MKFKSTGWEITGSSGITVKGGTPIANVEIGISYIRLPIANVKTGQKVLLKGVGAGGGVGLSISTPVVTASGSLDQFPSDGIGSIVEGISVPNSQYKASDFFGEIMVFSLSAGKELTGQLSGVLWLNQPVSACLARMNCSKNELKLIARKMLLNMYGVAVPPAGLISSVNDLFRRTKAAGCFAGMNVESQLIGAGADVFGYRVKA